jgi:hypothetical protein
MRRYRLAGDGTSAPSPRRSHAVLGDQGDFLNALATICEGDTAIAAVFLRSLIRRGKVRIIPDTGYPSGRCVVAHLARMHEEDDEPDEHDLADLLDWAFTANGGHT